MKRARIMIIAVFVTMASTAGAQKPAASSPPKPKVCDPKQNQVTVGSTVNLIALLQNPPRTKVILSIDGTVGFHREIVWDPTVGDGLKHDVLLPNGTYKILAYADEERVQTNELVMTRTTKFTACDQLNKQQREGCDEARDDESLLVGTQKTVLFTSSMTGAGSGSAATGPVPYTDPTDQTRPTIRIMCEQQGALQLSKVPLATKQLYAASVARGFLDQAAPKLVTDTLAILAEIAIERAKANVMDLVKERFVTPICEKLTLELLGLGGADERALPRTCALLENMRLQDLLASGRNLIEAASDDIRTTLVARIVERLDVPAAAQSIALIAIDLGNKLIDGSSGDATGIDLLFTQLDRLFRRSTLESFPAVTQAFVLDTFSEVRKQLGPSAFIPVERQFLRDILQRVLPQDPGEWISQRAGSTERERALAKTLLLAQVPECRRRKDTDRSFVAADRAQCITQLIEYLRTRPAWQASSELSNAVYGTLPPEQLVNIVGKLRASAPGGLGGYSEWLEAYAVQADKVRDLTAEKVPELLRRSCAVQVTLAIVKWCSGHDTCTASDIASALDNPETLFGPSNDNPLENLCWNNPTHAPPRKLQLPAVRTRYIELATRALTFLSPSPKGEERKRVQAMLRWVFDLAKTLDDKRASSVQQLAELLELFEKRDYVRAIGQTLALARCNEPLVTCSRSKEMKKAMELLGSIASYMQVYDDTKSADPAEAKAARKKAIETLIDSSTDRKERGRDLVVSLGSNVGMAYRWSSKTRDDFGLRVPLGLNLQFLPKGRVGDGELLEYMGLHAGVQLADLGQLIGTDDDRTITWSSFVAPGVEAGFLIGQPNRTFALTAHLSYAPTLTDDSKATWRVGLALSYYVPFFDLN